MEALVESFGDQVNPWGYLLLFALVLLEDAAFIGLAVPGETALMFAGFLAYEGRLRLWMLIVVAVLGAIIGDSLGYAVGHHLGGRIRRTWLGRLVGEERWDRARRYVRERGGKAVFLGRWVGVMRALVPAVAGDSRMPFKTFVKWNVAGALIQPPALIVIGYIAGGSYERVASYFGRVTLILFALVVIITVALHLIRKRREESEEQRG